MLEKPICSNCGESARYRGTECEACYSWRRRKNTPRPKRLIERSLERKATGKNAKPSTVYIFLSEKDEVLYIGMTANGTRRIMQHAEKYKEWWTLATKVNLLHCANVIEALELEKSLIEILSPRFNERLKPKLHSHP